MGENEEANGSCSKTETMAVYNYQQFGPGVNVEAFEVCHCTEKKKKKKKDGDI